ncbi:MAG: DUF456 domain-containing protein [Bacteroidales bacterium]|nr:DUF456 domain-containing protein [Bacteroidales bacterium]
MDSIFIILGIFFLIIGIIGAIVPVIPGPPLSYLGMLLFHFSSKVSFSTEMLIFYAVLMIVVTVIDYVIPVYGTKKMGGSNYGVWGATIGLMIGLFFFPPLGLIIGPFVGAFIGEIIKGKSNKIALKSAFGSFLGLVVGTILKLVTSLMITYHCMVNLF